MKIDVLQENLHAALNAVQKAVPSKPSLPILSSILITATKKGCTLSATDLYFGATSQFSAQVKEEGSIAIPGKQLREIIASLQPGKVSINLSNKGVSINAQKTKASLQYQSSEEYPPFPNVDGEEYIFSLKIFEEIAQTVSFAATNDQTRPVLAAALFSLSGQGLEVVATDGFRLARRVFELEKGSGGASEPFLLPASAIAEIVRLAKKSDGQEVKLIVSRESKQIFLSLGEVTLFVRLIEGEYPPYQSIIPSESATKIELDREELIDHIKRALIFARDASNIISFSCSSEKCVIESSSAALGKYSGELESAKVVGPGGTIAFNARYLLEFAQAVSSDQVVMEMSESLRPALFSTPDIAELQYVVMPFKVS